MKLNKCEESECKRIVYTSAAKYNKLLIFRDVDDGKETLINVGYNVLEKCKNNYNAEHKACAKFKTYFISCLRRALFDEVWNLSKHTYYYLSYVPYNKYVKYIYLSDDEREDLEVLKKMKITPRLKVMFDKELTCNIVKIKYDDSKLVKENDYDYDKERRLFLLSKYFAQNNKITLEKRVACSAMALDMDTLDYNPELKKTTEEILDDLKVSRDWYYRVFNQFKKDFAKWLKEYLKDER